MATTVNGSSVYGSTAQVRRVDLAGEEPAFPVPGVAGEDRLPGRQRRVGLVALGLLLTAGGAAVAGALALEGSGQVSVLVVAEPVPAGEVVEAADLREGLLAGSGVSAIAASDAAAVVGQAAAVDLLPGTLLTGDMVTDELAPGPGRALVGVAASQGQAPAGRLLPGVRVALVRTPPPGEGVTASVVTADGRVLGSQVDDASGLPVVTVDVPADAAVEASLAAAQAQLSVVVLPAGGDAVTLPEPPARAGAAGAAPRDAGATAGDDGAVVVTP